MAQHIFSFLNANDGTILLYRVADTAHFTGRLFANCEKCRARTVKIVKFGGAGKIFREFLLGQGTRVEKGGDVSLNTLVQESLAAVIREEEEREMYEATELLGQFPEECDVAYAFAAQAETALRNEP